MKVIPHPSYCALPENPPPPGEGLFEKIKICLYIYNYKIKVDIF